MWAIFLEVDLLAMKMRHDLEISSKCIPANCLPSVDEAHLYTVMYMMVSTLATHHDNLHYLQIVHQSPAAILTSA